MTIRAKLAVALGAILLVLVAPLAIAYRSLQDVHESAVALRDREFAASLLLGELRTGTEELRRAETALLFVRDVGSRDAMNAAVRDVAAMSDSLVRYDLDEAAAEIREAIREVGTLAQREYDAALAGRLPEAERISTTSVVPAIARIERSLGVAERTLRARTGSRVEETAENIAAAGRVAAGAAFVALVIALGIAAWLLRAIARPVTELQRGMATIAEGEFGYRLAIDASRRDEFGRLAASFQSMATQLAELDKLKAEFVSIASHELKTPINVILGYVQLLEEGAYGAVTAKQAEVLHTLDGQARSLARLTKQLLDVSRFEAGRGGLNPRAIELRAFLVELETAFRVLAEQRGVTLKASWGDDAPHEVQWDADRMNEVLGNLLSNAVKFTPQGGAVTLHAEQADGSVVLEVRDTGAGIPEAQLPYIFEKFYQADNQAAASQRGTGLGLAIAREIVDAHRGSISVESTPGVGTTFTILLPIHVTGRRATAQRAAVDGEGG